MPRLTYTQVGELIKQAGGTVDEQTIGAGIAVGAESGGTTTVLAGGVGPAAGLWQFEPTTWRQYAPPGAPSTATQATPLEQAQAFVRDVNANQGYASWAPDLGNYPWGSDPKVPAPGSTVYDYLKSVGHAPNTGAAPATLSTTRKTRPGAGPAVTTAITIGGLKLTGPGAVTTAAKTGAGKVVGGIFGPVISWIDNKAVRVGLVIGGAILVIVGIVMLIHGAEVREDAERPEEAQARKGAEHVAEAGAVAAE